MEWDWGLHDRVLMMRIGARIEFTDSGTMDGE